MREFAAWTRRKAEASHDAIRTTTAAAAATVEEEEEVVVEAVEVYLPLTVRRRWKTAGCQCDGAVTVCERRPRVA